MKGYAGRIIRVDLGEGKVSFEPLEEEWSRKYIGGTGLAARYLYAEIDGSTKPSDPQNPLIFMTGPLAGTAAITSGRHHVVSLSPLTGIFGESDVGGSWGEQLKRAGFDGIIVKGESKGPVYLWVTDGKAELRPAAHLWGMDSYEVDAPLRKETHEKATVSCIGPAGEREVPIASIMHDGTEGRAAGRCGLGAVMGRKRLKAIVVYGTGRVEVADTKGLLEAVKALSPLICERLEGMRKYGTSRMVQTAEQLGSMPLQNWKFPERWVEGAAKLGGPSLAEKIIVSPYFCKRCVIGCGNRVQVKAGPYKGVLGGGPEYETLNMLGANLLVDDLEAVAMANELCNRYGIDTICAGAAIGFAMEAYERGLITLEDTDGIDLTWGKADSMVEMVRLMGEAKGFGQVLGKGVRKAAEEIGRGAGEFAMHVKGLSVPAHDPRAYNGISVMYATSNRGAHHTSGQTHVYEHRMSVPELNHTPPGRFVVEGKGELAARTQNIVNVIDSAKTCKFAQFGGLTIGPVRDLYCYVTGREDTLEEVITHGERSFNLKRLINVARGISRKDDTLPKRFLTLAKEAEGLTPNLPPLERMLEEYYRYRGWDEEGAPLPETLERLDIP